MANVEMFEPAPADGLKVERQRFLHVPFDPLEQSAVLQLAGRSHRDLPFRYIVTPNADHVVRLNRQPELMPFYEQAWLTLCDSKPIHLFARTRARNLTHVTGSDLTNRLFDTVIRPGDRIVMIVATQAIATDIQAAYPDLDIRAHVPPAGLLNNRAAIEHCVHFVERERARFVFIAVGSPQSEKIAWLLARRGIAVGIGLCIGAALEFLVGNKKRAPLWMQQMSLEWLHRMAGDPKRLWRRYVYGAMPLMGLFLQEMSQRDKAGHSA